MDPILVPIVAIIFGCSIAIIAVLVSYFEEKKRMETIGKLAEAGKSKEEIIELLGKRSKIFARNTEEKTPERYMKNGIVLMGFGVGIVVFGFIIAEEAIVGIGAFLLILGLAYLIVHFFLRKRN